MTTNDRERTKALAALEKFRNNLTGALHGSAFTLLAQPSLTAADFEVVFATDPATREVLRMEMVKQLVDQALNHNEPGTDLRPLVMRMAELLGVDAPEDWQ